ncbi:hypothetical protein PsorP6_011570 [Peronosclerospora sorghi]|uniref:Uncharacterized protein n=1 Tax=Peronosclerospora sorghi TaxID=230839 RepID=A0ACC0WL00_9STRA|nr:hypothetical protein PsorP6_011570 [Peronosclerospora sorghi]
MSVYSEETNDKIQEIRNHQEAVSALLFAPDVKTLYTSSADKSIRPFETLGNMIWEEMRAHDHPVNRLHELSAKVFASGDDQGCIKIWDTWQYRCLASLRSIRTTFLDLRRTLPKIIYWQQVATGDDWGTWGDMSDRYPGHSDSIEALLKVDEDKVLTGSIDGIVRYGWQFFIAKSGRCDHEDLHVEILNFSRDKRIIGSTSHTKKLDDDVEVDTGDKNEEKGVSSVTVYTEMQELDTDSDSDDSDMGTQPEVTEYLLRLTKSYFPTCSRLSSELIPNYLY